MDLNDTLSEMWTAGNVAMLVRFHLILTKLECPNLAILNTSFLHLGVGGLRRRNNSWTTSCSRRASRSAAAPVQATLEPNMSCVQVEDLFSRRFFSEFQRLNVFLCEQCQGAGTFGKLHVLSEAALASCSPKCSVPGWASQLDTTTYLRPTTVLGVHLLAKVTFRCSSMKSSRTVHAENSVSSTEWRVCQCELPKNKEDRNLIAFWRINNFFYLPFRTVILQWDNGIHLIPSLSLLYW